MLECLFVILYFCLLISLYFCENRPGGEVDTIAMSPIGGAAAGDVEHARDAPGLVVVVSHLSFYTLL